MKYTQEDLKKAMLLYAVTDRRGLNCSLAAAIEEALKGGITILQLREKELPYDEFLAEAKEIRKLTRAYGIPFIINDSVEIALACDADGVHIGQDDTELAAARAALGPDKIIGVSAHNVEEALKAQAGGANYLGSGAIFPTGTKTNVTALSRETLKAITNAVSIPVVGIGGLTRDNIPTLKGTGLDGAAVVSAIFSAEDTGAATRTLRTICEETFL